MSNSNRIGKRGQELPGWAMVVALIIGLLVLAFLIWLAMKGQKVGMEQIGALP